jgi:N-methylhydantoinase A/oxoprolinase/acetone carboxylase beta subunit
MIGTTHFVNALVQQRDLARVGSLRIGAADRDPVLGGHAARGGGGRVGEQRRDRQEGEDALVHCHIAH